MYAGGTWPYDSWYLALLKSRTGQRLATLLEYARPLAIHYTNTTPLVGDCPNSIIPPDEKHIRYELADFKPDAVIAFGKQAEKALQSIVTAPLLVMPHPTYRCLTNNLLARAGQLLAGGFSGIVTLRQKRGHFEETRRGHTS